MLGSQGRPSYLCLEDVLLALEEEEVAVCQRKRNDDNTVAVVWQWRTRLAHRRYGDARIISLAKRADRGPKRHDWARDGRSVSR
ncbi:hypothetical protein HN011_011199 [Eciton burchellii]|nr:hypothetical protein HN011_011199 [Eciton burchellii]